MPSISTRRIRPVPMGGFTDIVLTRPGLARSSSSVIQRVPTAASRSIKARSWSWICSRAMLVGQVEIETAVTLADGAARHRIRQDDGEEMQRRVDPHSRVARRPMEPRRHGLAPDR